MPVRTNDLIPRLWADRLAAALQFPTTPTPLQAELAWLRASLARDRAPDWLVALVIELWVEHWFAHQNEGV